MDRLKEWTIPKELCASGPTRLGGPFGVGWVLLQQFKAFGNKSHPLSNGYEKLPIVPITWVAHGQFPNDVSFFNPIAYDTSKPNRQRNSRPPPNLIDNKLEFEMEVVLKSRQLKGQEQEYLVKWKGCHPIKASWVNEMDMEHAQKTIGKFHNKPAKKQKKHKMWWKHHLSFSGVGNYTNVPH